MPSLSVVIPVFNEIATIETVVERVIAASQEDVEIICVDDGSTDGTGDLLREKLEPRGVQVLVHGQNRGKGAALRTGFAAATREVEYGLDCR